MSLGITAFPGMLSLAWRIHQAANFPGRLAVVFKWPRTHSALALPCIADQFGRVVIVAALRGVFAGWDHLRFRE